MVAPDPSPGFDADARAVPEYFYPTREKSGKLLLARFSAARTDAKSLFRDLLCRILRAYERGGVSLRELAERLGVSWDYVKKIRMHQLCYGQMERVRQERHGPVSRGTPAVEEQLRARADLTLEDCASGCAKKPGWS
jgi:ribosome-binding protein aMBF1 (putative translation factor)